MTSTKPERCRTVKQRLVSLRHVSILFSNGNMFTIEKAHSRQNDRTRTRQILGTTRVVGRTQYPESVMDWAGIAATGKAPMIFIDYGVRINQEVYRCTIHSRGCQAAAVAEALWGPILDVPARLRTNPQDKAHAAMA
uniref:Uncharacterized protein n=1 Tax=Plectus sambesii TaxID=2011161 RepID=A0A914WKH6_9BILA